MTEQSKNFDWMEAQATHHLNQILLWPRDYDYKFNYKQYYLMDHIYRERIRLVEEERDKVREGG